MRILELEALEPSQTGDHFYGVLGRSAVMRELFETLAKIAPTELTCLIEGETGTGKERVARAIHEASARADGPYIVLDCSSIPSTLVESYLFGHEKGAFTGAQMRRKGVFEQAQGGTLFLDEIGELDLELQPRLLRVLENCEFKRVGGSRTIRSDCRIVAASNRVLGSMVGAGAFREDLYFRLSIMRLTLKPLRERPADIAFLAEHFLRQFDPSDPSDPEGGPIELSPEARDALRNYRWPGNIRELKNVVARAASLCDRQRIERLDLCLGDDLPVAVGLEGQAPSRVQEVSGHPGSPSACGEQSRLGVNLSQDYKDAREQLLMRFERAYLEQIFGENAGNISKSARAAGISRYYMRQLLKKHKMI